MTTDIYISSLKKRHEELEHAIAEETNRPLPDDILVQMLKRQKLRIKDKLHRIEEPAAAFAPSQPSALNR